MYREFSHWAKYIMKGEDLLKDKETRVTIHNALVKRIKRLIFYYGNINLEVNIKNMTILDIIAIF